MPKSRQSPFDSVEKALARLAKGKPIVVTDDENRENEGDLVLAASEVTPETVNMMIRHARGLICVPMTGPSLRRFGLNPMTPHNREAHGTDFAVSVDAAEGIATGISAHDRARTIRLLADPGARPEDLVQPGHIFPLRSRPGGVLERAGHTEAAVDLTALAGLPPCGVICEILNDDGSCARLRDLVRFKNRFKLPLVSIAELIAYRRQREKFVERVRQLSLGTAHGRFDLHVFRNTLDGRCHFALTKGKLDARPILTRVCAENLPRDVFQASPPPEPPCFEACMRRLSREKRCALLYLTHPGGGIRLPGDKAPLRRARGRPSAADSSFRDYGVGAQILSALGLKKIRLLSSGCHHPVALEGHGLEIVGHTPLKRKSTG